MASATLCATVVFASSFLSVYDLSSRDAEADDDDADDAAPAADDGTLAEETPPRSRSRHPVSSPGQRQGGR